MTRSRCRLRWGTLILSALLFWVTVAIGQQGPGKYGKVQPGADAFRLFSAPTLILSGNRVQCSLVSVGHLCTTFNYPEVQHGLFWPAGTSDGYVFGGGPWLAGINSEAAGPWANDTVGAYIYPDPTGTDGHGTALTELYDSLDPEDLESWPAEAYISNPDVYSPVLLGRKTASQQDTWVQYWDGDPQAAPGERQHPMGILVSQRSLSWTYPLGNESVIYFVLEFENVTDDPEFQRMNEDLFFGGDDALPDSGWSMSEMYVGIFVDSEVSSLPFDWFGNYATAILPFDLGIGYHGGFSPEGYTYPPSVFYPPFFTDASGIVGVKFLQSPVDPITGEQIGLSLFSATTNPGAFISPFPSPQGDRQLWRYLSGNLDSALGDPTCSLRAEIETGSPATTERSLCFNPDLATDLQFYQSSGPFDLAPGGVETMIVAYMVGPTVETMPDGSPSGIVRNPANVNANPPGVPSFHPGYGSARGCDINGQSCAAVSDATENEIRTIERGAGWIRYDGPPPSGSIYPADVEHRSNKIDQFEVRVVPGSLLGRALVAQSVFDSQFLLGFAPEPPPFYLVPGDDQVTVVWEPSVTEVAGDPFYELASDPESALYNPNYRQNDVEGYRIWRGTLTGNLDLIAQFDYADTEFFDYTCETVHPEEDVGAMAVSTETGNLIPVIGYAAGEICPFDVDDPLVRPLNSTMVFNNGSPGGPPGGGVSSMPRAASIDTVIVSDRVTGPTAVLSDTGVPFVYVDQSVINSFTYFYAVTAFDVNSMASGPHTLRSVQNNQSVIPRADAPEIVYAGLQMFLVGENGESLDTRTRVPDINEATGTFSGPMPPSNAVTQTFAPLVERLLPTLSLTARIDSVVPVFSLGSSFGEPTEDCPVGGDPFHVCLKMYATVSMDGSDAATVVDIYNPWWASFGEDPIPQTARLVTQEVEFDAESLEAFGIPEASATATATGEFNEALNLSSTEGSQNRRWVTEYVDHGGSRWFDGAREEIADPTRYIRVGHLDAVDTVWSPIAYTSVEPGAPVSCVGGDDCSHFEKVCFERAMGKLGVAADIEVTWQGGAVSVRNVTHGTPVPFAPKVRASWGFLTTDANGNGFVDWNDFNYLDPALETIRDGVGGGECGGAGLGDWVPLGPSVDLVDTPAIVSTSTDGIRDGQNFADGLVATGTGFGLYIHGERYIFEMSELPADGTIWTLRTYSGAVTSDETSFESEDPTGYGYVESYTGAGTATRPLLVPGLTLTWRVERATSATGPTDLTQVHTVPDPYLASGRYDRAPTTKKLMFVNLPPQATIRIYSVTGVLVDILNHDDPSGGGRAEWDLRNRNNQYVASAVYFFHVTTPEGDEHVGKFTVIISSGRS